MGGVEGKRGAPDEGIMLIPDDVEIGEEGTASDGTIIYEIQTAIIEFWTTTRTDRIKAKDDLESILKPKNSGLAIQIMSLLPTEFLDKFGVELRIRRID